MKVLIIGATGFVGFPVAQAFVRAGHEVFGTTRSQDKARQLRIEEITPVIASKPEDWNHLVEKLDIVIDAGGALGPDPALANLRVVEAASLACDRPSHLKITYIYTSGTWGHGNSAEFKDERNARFNPPDLIAWRPSVEEQVIKAQGVSGVVIRPAMVYGRSASIIGALFKAAAVAKENGGSFAWAATPGNRWGTIHQDDLADLYVKVAESAPIATGLVLDAANPFTESVQDVVSVLGKVTGTQGSLRTPETLFEKAVDTMALTRPSLGAALFGWRTKKMGLVDGMTVYYSAWEASETQRL